MSKYKVGVLATEDDAEFHRWVAPIVAGQPKLLNAYVDLFECWQYYHGKKPDANKDSKKSR